MQNRHQCWKCYRKGRWI